MKINLIISFFGHNIVLGIGAGIEKSEENATQEVVFSELHSQAERASVGFMRNEEDEDWEDKNVGVRSR